MKPILALVVALVCSVALGQGSDGSEYKKHEPKNVKTSAAPVSRAEASKVFEKAWKAISKGLKIKGANPVKIVADGKPVTKDEVVKAIHSIVTLARPSFKRSATPVKYNAARERKDFDQATYSKLVKDGFIMPVGPLVVGKNGPLSTAEFGDAIGVMLIRLADLCHMPLRKFSPAIMDPNG